jgi:purine-nucleoside phosphorylase
MVIRDHIACFIQSPLIGENVDELGTRFPDMSEVYNGELTQLMLKCGKNLGVELKQGVYCQLSGPQYETPSEVKLVGLLGGDAVGMSTACEAIAANHAGMAVCGVSCITNMAAGVSDKPLSHSEVQETADKTAELFKALVRSFIGELKK